MRPDPAVVQALASAFVAGEMTVEAQGAEDSRCDSSGRGGNVDTSESALAWERSRN